MLLDIIDFHSPHRLTSKVLYNLYTDGSHIYISSPNFVSNSSFVSLQILEITTESSLNMFLYRCLVHLTPQALILNNIFKPPLSSITIIHITQTWKFSYLDISLFQNNNCLFTFCLLCISSFPFPSSMLITLKKLLSV